MRLTLQLVSLVVSLLSAWLWWRASQQPHPPAMTVNGVPDISVHEWLRSSAQWNSWAARCTAFAVVVQAASGFWR